MNFLKPITVDVSCYLCFEATGDSDESPSHADDPFKDPNIACRLPLSDDDDDAQSCCYDSSDHHSPINSDEDDELEVCAYGTTTTTTYKEEEEDDDDDDDDCEMQEQKKVRACADSGAEKMDEREKNRLFWEACLAS